MRRKKTRKANANYYIKRRKIKDRRTTMYGGKWERRKQRKQRKCEEIRKKEKTENRKLVHDDKD